MPITDFYSEIEEQLSEIDMTTMDIDALILTHQISTISAVCLVLLLPCLRKELMLYAGEAEKPLYRLNRSSSAGSIPENLKPH